MAHGISRKLKKKTFERTSSKKRNRIEFHLLSGEHNNEEYKKKTNEKSFAIDENTKWQRGNTKFVQFACDNIKTNEPKRFSFLLLFLL